MPILTFVTFAALTVSLGAVPPSKGTVAARHRHTGLVRREAHLPANELYSLRARRRFASYLRLRLLEMREAGLERAAAVVERRLPVDALVPAPPQP